MIAKVVFISFASCEVALLAKRGGLTGSHLNKMAQKRMFDRAVIENRKFLRVSLTSKAAYFLLGMEADDEGFVDPERVMRLYKVEVADIKSLAEAELVIPFKSGVVVITDWNKNNWLDGRRIRPTEYQEEKKQVVLTDKKEYVLSIGAASIEEYRGEENSTEQIAAAAALPFSLEEEIRKMQLSERRDLRVIGWFIKEKKIALKSKAQLSATIKRHLRAAKLLDPFDKSQIMGAAEHADRKIGNAWTLETLWKYLTK